MRETVMLFLTTPGRPEPSGGVSPMESPWLRGTLSRAAQPGGPSDGLVTTQKRILDYVSEHPGTHLRLICRELGLAMGDVQYHVQRLEREGRINSVRRGLYRFFYPSALFGEKQKDILGVLALDTPRELLLSIVEKPDSTQEELGRAVGVSQPTVSWHLKRMTALGVLQRHQSGGGFTYSIMGAEAGEVAALIKNYHPGVWERWASRLADIFISYSGEERGEQA